MNAHLMGDDAGEGRLPKSRRSVKKHVIQRLIPLFRRFDINMEDLLDPGLSDIIVQPFRPQPILRFDIFFDKFRCDDPFVHILSVRSPV